MNASDERLDRNKSTGDNLIIHLRNIRKHYFRDDGSQTPILKRTDLQVHQGEFVAIRGESGSGKTTLLKILGLMDREFDGTYKLFGFDIAASSGWLVEEIRSERIGFVFQEGRFLEHLSIKDNIELPLILRNLTRTKDYDRAEAEKFYRTEKLDEGVLDRLPKELSGGERQRAAIWRSIKTQPMLILADEPTASLDSKLREEIFQLFMQLQALGNTIVVISHDAVFDKAPRVLQLTDGRLSTVKNESHLYSPPPIPTAVDQHDLAKKNFLWGFRPRSNFFNLIRFAGREAFSRWVYLLLSVGALIIGIVQATVLLSVRDGAQEYINNALQTGSRLTRIEVKPKTSNRDEDIRFPEKEEISELTNVIGIVERRETIFRVLDNDGESTGWRALGLHPMDPEYNSFEFLAGTEIKNSSGLDAIVTASLLNMIAPSEDPSDRATDYEGYIGQTITLELKQHASQTVVRHTIYPKLKIVGVIAEGEKGKQLYLPTTTLLVFDKWRRDRQGREPAIPLDPSGMEWTTSQEELITYGDFPWQDKLQVYVHSLQDVLPTFRKLSNMRYSPESEIFDYQWVIDAREIAVSGLTVLVVAAAAFAGFVVWINIWSAAKIREAEFALYRLLGMRRGDLVFGQLLSALIATVPAVIVGNLIGKFLIGSGRQYLVSRYPDEDYAQIFAPVADGIVPILIGVVVITLFAALFPSLRVSNADPVKLLT